MEMKREGLSIQAISKLTGYDRKTVRKYLVKPEAGIEDDDDVLTAMARELVTQRGVGESASAVWKAVQEQHARLLPALSVSNEENREELAPGPFDEVVAVDGRVASLVFGAWLQKESPRRRPLVEPDCQISLF